MKSECIEGSAPSGARQSKFFIFNLKKPRGQKKFCVLETKKIKKICFSTKATIHLENKNRHSFEFNSHVGK